jgi:1-phosphofructokinase family hexose kinase
MGCGIRGLQGGRSVMSNTVVTLTLNTAIDRVIVIHKLRLREKNVALRTLALAGGKGVNVARALAALHIPVIATGFIGHREQELYRSALEPLGVNTRFVLISGHTRTNYKFVEQGTAAETEVNEPGPVISLPERQELDNALDELLSSATMLVLSGSLPPGIPHDYYAQCIGRASARHVPCALDSSGQSLRLALQHRPELVKINRAELSEALGKQLPSTADVAHGLRALCATGIGVAAASLGADGAIATDGRETWLATAPPVAAKNPIGAGDVMLAGLMASLLKGDTVQGALRWATALATASVTNYEPGIVDVAVAEDLQQQVDLVLLEAV